MIIIDIKCTINVVCSNHAEIIPLPWSMETLSSTTVVPGARMAGDCCQSYATCGRRDCQRRAVPRCQYSGSPQLRARGRGWGAESVPGVDSPLKQGAVEGGKSSVTKVTANMFVGKKTKTDIGQWESISLRHPEKGQTAYKLSPWRLKRRNVCLPAPVLQHSARPWCTRLGPGLPWHSHGADSLCVQEPHPELRWP